MLRTDYKDDILAAGQSARKYRMIQNVDSTVSLEDVTDYTQEGDPFGAADINATNTAVNALEDSKLTTTTFSIATTDWTANAGSDSADFPYVCEISSALYSNTYVPAEVLLLGADTSDYPSSSEMDAIGLVDQYIKFTTSGVRLRATAAPSVTLTLVVRG